MDGSPIIIRHPFELYVTLSAFQRQGNSDSEKSFFIYYFGCIGYLLHAQASHCGILFCFRALTLRQASVIACRLRSCTTQAWYMLLRGMWNLPGPGIEPVSPALEDGFFTSGPPGKSS